MYIMGLSLLFTFMKDNSCMHLNQYSEILPNLSWFPVEVHSCLVFGVFSTAMYIVYNCRNLSFGLATKAKECKGAGQKEAQESD